MENKYTKELEKTNSKQDRLIQKLEKENHINNHLIETYGNKMEEKEKLNGEIEVLKNKQSESEKMQGIIERTTQEYFKTCPLCNEGYVTGSSVKQLESRLGMHQRSKKCIKKQEKNAS